MVYFVRYKEETIKYTDFYEKNRNQIVMGKMSIIEAAKIHKKSEAWSTTGKEWLGKYTIE